MRRRERHDRGDRDLLLEGQLQLDLVGAVLREIALYGDGTGRFHLSSGAICGCPINTTCDPPVFTPVDFAFAETGPGTVLISDGGLTLTCPPPAQGTWTMTSLTGVSGGMSSGTLEFDVHANGNLFTNSGHFIATLVSGTF